ncbi:MAG TPA: RNHCP domain-containing protein [Actinomycetes bacterium]|nr:RNHCP domain-containing protein [Actinomycetes bacterium]
MTRTAQNQGFTCENCGIDVLPLTNGSYRNHCPACLCSKHVDNRPGDRAAGCGGLMRPVALDYRPRKGQLLVHRCDRCGRIQPNRVAVDCEQPDDLDVLLRVAHGLG